MATEPAPFPELIEGLLAGDDDAARAVHDRWTRRLIALARSRLGAAVAGKEEPEDVVQSVYRSFFRRFRDGHYEAESWDDVWALLSVIALRKCSNRRSYYSAGRRDSRREIPLIADDRAGPSPSPDGAAMLVETVENLLKGLDPPERSIVELSFQGCSTREISERLGRPERSVQRVREHIKARLQSRVRGPSTYIEAGR